MAEKPKYDQDTAVRGGRSIVVNETGRPEPVLTQQQWRQIFDRRDR